MSESNVLIYDLNSLPETGDVSNMAADIIKLYQKEKLVFYDSCKGGNKPEIYTIDVNEIDVKFIDVSEQENMKQFNNYRKKIK